MRKINSQKGITLIALIITIVVLLILAVVAIGAVQEDGIIGKAKYARDEYEKAQAKEKSILQGYLDKINENVGNGSGETNSTQVTMEEAQSDIMLTKTLNSDVIDRYNNKITVPAGFKILVDDTTGYTADTIDVTQGIVIQDANGNEFVWVPVGDVYYSETEYKTINLNRYAFEEDGTPIPLGDAIIEDSYGDGWQEIEKSTYGNLTAKDLQGFINNTTIKGGYYLARYEAGVTNYDTTKTSYINEMGYVAEEGKELQLVSKKDVQVWNCVTQREASTLSQNMYKEATTFTSDLVNSYAWDTAIVFIQTFSNDSNYANSLYCTSLENTGVNLDKYCNIHDMSGNVAEWSTETYFYYHEAAVPRGGGYYRWTMAPGGKTKQRSQESGGRFEEYSFRPILYIGNSKDSTEGKYVKYDANGNGSVEDETILWRVLRDDEDKVELITADALGNVTLDATSFEAGRTSYNNMVELMVQECERVTGISGVRNIGGPAVDTTETVDFSELDFFSPTVSDDNFAQYEGENGLKVGDDNFEEDYKQMEWVGIVKADNLAEYWFASRFVSEYSFPHGVFFGARCINTTGGWDDLAFSIIFSDAGNIYGDHYRSCSVRPVLTLEAGILDEVLESGTKDDPIKIY